MLPLVSIITPAYNAIRYIDETIASVLAQDYRNIEHVIVDDASTDETVARVMQWIAISDRIKLIQRIQNGGPGLAINNGVDASLGMYLVPLAADDKLVPNYASSCIQLLQNHSKVGLVYTDRCYFRVHDDNHVYRRVAAAAWDAEELRRQNYIGPGTFMVRRSIFNTVGGYRDIPQSEDYDFTLACAGLGVICMPLHSVTTHIRVRPDSRWASATAESVLETDRMLQERHGHDIVPLYSRRLHGSA